MLTPYRATYSVTSSVSAIPTSFSTCDHDALSVFVCIRGGFIVLEISSYPIQILAKQGFRTKYQASVCDPCDVLITWPPVKYVL